jgi:hypothetical protein
MILPEEIERKKALSERSGGIPKYPKPLIAITEAFHNGVV